MAKLSEVEKTAREFSHGLDFSNFVSIDLKNNNRYCQNHGSQNWVIKLFRKITILSYGLESSPYMNGPSKLHA